MKTLLRKILSAIPWKTLLQMIAEMRLGTQLWNIVFTAVTLANSLPDASGETKFQQATVYILADGGEMARALPARVLRWAIETAVAVLKG